MRYEVGGGGGGIWTAPSISCEISGVASLLENYRVIVAVKLVTWSENFARESRNCVAVRSRGADQVCRFSVDLQIFTRIDVHEFF